MPSDDFNYLANLRTAVFCCVFFGLQEKNIFGMLPPSQAVASEGLGRNTRVYVTPIYLYYV